MSSDSKNCFGFLVYEISELRYTIKSLCCWDRYGHRPGSDIIEGERSFILNSGEKGRILPFSAQLPVALLSCTTFLRLSMLIFEQCFLCRCRAIVSLSCKRWFCGEVNDTWNTFSVKFDCVYIWTTLEASCFFLCIFLYVWTLNAGSLFIDPPICCGAALSLDHSSSGCRFEIYMEI